MKLSVLCVTRGDARAIWFLRKAEELSVTCGAELIVVVDGEDLTQAASSLRAPLTRVLRVRSAGFIESVLDRALIECIGQYVLRLDDDEVVSRELTVWLVNERYLSRDHWCFQRAWLWPDAQHRLSSEPHWPDYQTRLSRRHMAGGRRRPHEGSPYGAGEACAEGAIEHHKLLLWSAAERQLLVDRYEQLVPGTRGALTRFYLPLAGSTTVGWTG